jgi:NAD(P)-dependent dehydrogenase (short-subunit alcohol dehydrogenase family)
LKQSVFISSIRPIRVLSARQAEGRGCRGVYRASERDRRASGRDRKVRVALKNKAEGKRQRLFSLENRTVVVTGALGLLGKQHCRALAEAGANVVAADLEHNACRSFASELSIATSTDSLGVAVNIADTGSVMSLRDAVIRKYDRIDVLVNNAGVDDAFRDSSGESVKLESYPLEAWRRTLDVNITGTFLCCQILGSEMARCGRGSIINIASIYGIVAPDQSIYRSPAGTQSFFKSAAYPVSRVRYWR